jgi:hypothetical protein
LNTFSDQPILRNPLFDAVFCAQRNNVERQVAKFQNAEKFFETDKFISHKLTAPRRH